METERCDPTTIPTSDDQSRDHSNGAPPPLNTGPSASSPNDDGGNIDADNNNEINVGAAPSDISPMNASVDIQRDKDHDAIQFLRPERDSAMVY